jgi:hypothetical protein
MVDEPRQQNLATEVQLTATASTPVELLQAGLRAVLDLAREGQPKVAAVGTVAIPVRGLGPDLERLFLDLCDDLINQIEEHGLGLDKIALDGLLRTDTGGYTAWGYLSGVAGDGAVVNLALLAESVVITPGADSLALSCTVRIGEA